jgi:homoprotocatechuate degradation regulator HpaR
MDQIPSRPKTSRSLPIALLRAREKVMGPIREMLSDVDVTEQQWRVLRVLEENGPLDPTHIASEACLLMPSLTRILQKLDDKGLVLRSNDPLDGRKQRIEASDAAKDLIRQNMATSMNLTAQMRSTLGDEKFETLLDLLNELDQLDLSTKHGTSA